jgi:hypothetical protein
LRGRCVCAWLQFHTIDPRQPENQALGGKHGVQQHMCKPLIGVPCFVTSRATLCVALLVIETVVKKQEARLAHRHQQTTESGKTVGRSARGEIKARTLRLSISMLCPLGTQPLHQGTHIHAANRQPTQHASLCNSLVAMNFMPQAPLLYSFCTVVKPGGAHVLVCGVLAPARFLTRPFLGPPLPGVSKFLFLCFALGLPIVCYLRGGMCSYFVQFCTRLPTLTWCQHPFQEHRADETRQINEQRCVIHVLQTQQELQRACRLQGLATVSVLGASRSR